MKITTSTHQGFTLVEIMIVVALVALLAAIAIPNLVKAREDSQRNLCITNLRKIDSAAQTWALENHKYPGDTYTLDILKDYLRDGRIPDCPANGQYAPGASVGDPPTCTISGHGIL